MDIFQQHSTSNNPSKTSEETNEKILNLIQLLHNRYPELADFIRILWSQQAELNIPIEVFTVTESVLRVILQNNQDPTLRKALEQLNLATTFYTLAAEEELCSKAQAKAQHIFVLGQLSFLCFFIALEPLKVELLLKNPSTQEEKLVLRATFKDVLEIIFEDPTSSQSKLLKSVIEGETNTGAVLFMRGFFHMYIAINDAGVKRSLKALKSRLPSNQQQKETREAVRKAFGSRDLEPDEISFISSLIKSNDRQSSTNFREGTKRESSDDGFLKWYLILEILENFLEMLLDSD